MPEHELITDRTIYTRVIQQKIPAAESFVWIGTADIKDLHVNRGPHMVPFLKVLSDLIENNIHIRLIHAKEPGPRFRKDFDRYPNLWNGMERILCQRVHFKTVIVDGTFAYSGSANLTGAGMGAKGDSKRNFETGLITTDPTFIETLMNQFDSVWMGKHCPECRYSGSCGAYSEMTT